MKIKPPYKLRDLDRVPVIIAESVLPGAPPCLVAHPIDVATGRDIVTACNFHAAQHELIEKFGTAVTNMFEQMQKCQWRDELWHSAAMNKTMLDLIAPVNEAILLREAISAAAGS